MTALAWRGWSPRDEATLCFIRQGDRVLLIHKKRGLGAGKINGVGGKLEPGETALEAMQREAQEELGIGLLDPEPRATLHFQFRDGYGLRCTVYVATRFSGEPVATAEADPLWFSLQALPLERMWEDDRLWLPQLLDGHRLQGYFHFDGDRMVSHLVEWEEPVSGR